jgi:hypothetical protein
MEIVGWVLVGLVAIGLFLDGLASVIGRKK